MFIQFRHVAFTYTVILIVLLKVAASQQHVDIYAYFNCTQRYPLVRLLYSVALKCFLLLIATSILYHYIFFRF